MFADPPKIDIRDEFLLSELIESLIRVCQTSPFLKSKTSQFIQDSFLVSTRGKSRQESSKVGSDNNIQTILQNALDFLNE